MHIFARDDYSLIANNVLTDVDERYSLTRVMWDEKKRKTKRKMDKLLMCIFL